MRFDYKRIITQPSATEIVGLTIAGGFGKAGFIEPIVKTIRPKEEIGYAAKSKTRIAWRVIADGWRVIRKIKNAKRIAYGTAVWIDAVRRLNIQPCVDIIARCGIASIRNPSKIVGGGQLAYD